MIRKTAEGKAVKAAAGEKANARDAAQSAGTANKTDSITDRQRYCYQGHSCTDTATQGDEHSLGIATEGKVADTRDAEGKATEGTAKACLKPRKG